MLCFRCGEDNPHGSNVCNRCNAKLPKISINVAPTISGPRTDRLMQILDIGNKMLDGKASPQILLTRLEKQEKDFQKGERDLIKSMPRAKPRPPGYVKPKHPNPYIAELPEFDEELETAMKSEFQEQYDCGLKSIRLFLQSLNSMRIVLEEIIDEGLDEETPGKKFEVTEEQEATVKEAMDIARRANEVLNGFYEMAEEKDRRVREVKILYEDDSTLL